MIVLLAGGAALSVLMRENRPVPEPLAPARMDQGSDDLKLNVEESPDRACCPPTIHSGRPESPVPVSAFQKDL